MLSNLFLSDLFQYYFPTYAYIIQVSLYFRFPHQNSECISFSPHTGHIPTHLIFNLITQIIPGEQYKL